MTDTHTTDTRILRREYMNAYMKSYRQENPKKRKRIDMTLSNQEYSDFKKRSDAEGKRITTGIKELALIALYERDNFPEKVNQNLHELTLILRGVATNINQMARNSNQLKQFSEQEALILKIRFLEDQVHSFLQSQQLRNNHDH